MEDQMNDNAVEQDDGFADFASAFQDPGYQTGDEDGNETEETTEESTEEAGESAEAEKTEEKHADTDGEKATSQASEEATETFTIKVNKEEKTLSREEMVSLAQKGSDYDRVRQQRDESRAEAQSLRDQIQQSQEVLDMLNMVSKASDIPVAQMVENLYISMQKGKGIDETAAREALRADKLQRQIDAMEARKNQQKAQEDAQTGRAQREVAEFRSQFPDVQLTEELVDKLTADVQSGMSMVSAYRKLETQQRDERIAELERELAAERQNKRNQEKSPGSLSDSGGRRVKSDFEDFRSALFG